MGGPVGGHRRVLADAPGQGRVVVAGVQQRRDAGQEEDDVEDEVEAGLRARPHRAVEEIAAYVRVLRQRVGAGEHEQGAVEHVAGVEHPGRRHVEGIALEDLDADQPISAMISHAAALPTQVLMPSTVWRKLLDAHGRQPTVSSTTGEPRGAIRSYCRTAPGGRECFRASSRRRSGRNSGQRHPAVDHGVLLPTRHPLGEGDLRVRGSP